MEYSIKLFTIDEFQVYGSYASDIVDELNTILKDEDSRQTASGETLHHLRKDMLNSPDLYLSDTMTAKLHLAEANNSKARHS